MERRSLWQLNLWRKLEHRPYSNKIDGKMEKWKLECEAKGLRKKRREGRKEKERGGQEKHVKWLSKCASS